MPAPDQPRSRYIGPTEILRRHGKTYVYDAGTGEIIAELTPEAADKIRTHTPAKMTYDGDTVHLENP